MIVIVLLYLLQLLVTSTIQDQLGVYREGQARPSVTQPSVFVPLADEEAGTIYLYYCCLYFYIIVILLHFNFIATYCVHICCLHFSFSLNMTGQLCV
jgi:hypothetical protein